VPKVVQLRSFEEKPFKKHKSLNWSCILCFLVFCAFSRMQAWLNMAGC
jgi:hypothetical protein